MEYKAGFQGKDAMRAKAEKLMGKVASASLKEKMPSSAVGKEKPRPYAAGGLVKGAKNPNAEMSLASRDKAPMKKGGCVKMAAGGVGKIRHDQATPAGKPIKKR